MVPFIGVEWCGNKRWVGFDHFPKRERHWEGEGEGKVMGQRRFSEDEWEVAS
jgi:hypothetical protein